MSKFTLFLFAFYFHVSYATTFYVSPQGSDDTGDGGISNPWQTIAYGVRALNNMDGEFILQIAAGVYELEESLSVATGVSLVGNGPGNTIIRSSSSAVFNLISFPVTYGNQSIESLTIDGRMGSAEVGIQMIGRHNVQFIDLEILHTASIGIDLHSGDGNIGSEPEEYLENIIVSGCTFTNCAADKVDSGYSTGALQIGHLNAGRIYNNTINEDEGYGIKFSRGGWFKQLELFENEIYTPREDPLWGSDISIELWDVHTDSKVYDNWVNNWISIVGISAWEGEYGVEVFDNKVIMPEAEDGNLTIGIEIIGSDAYVHHNYIENFNHGIAYWGDFSDSNIIIRNNILYNGYQGIIIQPFDSPAMPTLSDIYIYNNTFDELYTGVAFQGESSPCVNIRNVKIKNNVFTSIIETFTLWNEGLCVDGLEINNNAFDEVTSDLVNYGSALSNDIFLSNDQLFTEVVYLREGDRWGRYYQLAPASPLIDTGLDLGFEFEGTAPDIGAIETSVPTAIINHDIYRFEVFPNPAQDIISIQGDLPIDQISLYTLDGKSIYKQKASTSNPLISLSQLSPGLYMLEIVYGKFKQREYHKLQVQ